MFSACGLLSSLDATGSASFGGSSMEIFIGADRASDMARSVSASGRIWRNASTSLRNSSSSLCRAISSKLLRN